jgi:hypothetical protein
LFVKANAAELGALGGSARAGEGIIREMTSDERVSLIRLKVERANQHFRELQIARDRFLKADPYRIESNLDPKTGNKIFYAADVRTPPAEIGIVAGDVIHNLRSALDHLACQLVIANGCAPTRATCFPIFDSATKYKSSSAGKVTGMAQAAIDIIDATKPYKGGNGAGLWVLHYLDIADKHHALLTTLLNLTRVDFTITGYWEPGYKGVGDIAFPGFGKPLEDGTIIAIRDPNAHNDMNFAIDIAFIEPPVIKRKPIIETVQCLTDCVNDLITNLKPLL